MHACIDREDAVLAMMILVSAGGMLAVLYCEKEPQSHSDVTPMLICWLLACMHCEHPSFTQEVYSIEVHHKHTNARAGRPTHTTHTTGNTISCCACTSMLDRLMKEVGVPSSSS